MSLPRDSYVDIAGGFGTHKLNSAYARAKNAEANRLRATASTRRRWNASRPPRAGRT